MAQFGQVDFRTDEGEDLIQPSTVQERWTTASGDRTFTETDAPRFMTVDVGGTLVCEDWAGTPNSITRNVLQGQVLAFRPSKLTASGSTAEVILEW